MSTSQPTGEQPSQPLQTGCGCLILIFMIYGIASAVGPKSCSSTPSGPVHKAIDGNVGNFARAELPEIVSLIDNIRFQTADRKTKLDALKNELSRLDRDPEQDSDYVRWNKAISTLHSQSNELVQQLEDVYLAHRKLELSPKGSGDQEEYQAKLAAAKVKTEKTKDEYGRVLIELETGKQ